MKAAAAAADAECVGLVPPLAKAPGPLPLQSRKKNKFHISAKVREESTEGKEEERGEEAEAFTIAVALDKTLAAS